MIKVQVTAQSPVVRAGLEALLKESGSIEIVLAASDADVVVADREPPPEGPPAVLLTDDPTESLRLGIRGILPPHASESEIEGAVKAVAAGLIAIHPQFVDAVSTPIRGAIQPLDEPLTPRELEVLRLLAEGTGNKEIAHRLGISEHTVKFHVASLLDKLHAGSRTEAVSIGIRAGLVML